MSLYVAEQRWYRSDLLLVHLPLEHQQPRPQQKNETQLHLGNEQMHPIFFHANLRAMAYYATKRRILSEQHYPNSPHIGTLGPEYTILVHGPLGLRRPSCARPQHFAMAPAASRKLRSDAVPM